MTILTARMLRGKDNDGNELDVSLIFFAPFEAGPLDWRCKFAFDPPIIKTSVYGAGVDYLHSIIEGFKYARMYFGLRPWAQAGHWDGMHDFGLPCREEKPTPYQPADIPSLEAARADAQVLATRGLACPDENGVEREITLTVFAPYEAAEATWRCGFTFEALPVSTVYYGTGADFIEALLDALSIARAVFERKAPPGWASTGDLLDCADFPYKNGRSYRTDLPSTGASAKPTLADSHPPPASHE